MKPQTDPQVDQRVAAPIERNGIRLQKVLARSGYGSRRKCEELVAKGAVRVNGEVARLGRRIDPELDRVTVNGIPVSVDENLVYYLLNKPAGVVSTAADTHGRRTVVELVPAAPRVFPVGRLDADSEGLLILTNDGDLANRLTHPSHEVEKEYFAQVENLPSPANIRRLREGVELDDGMTAPAKVTAVAPSGLRIAIHEGRNRQVRRMCESVGSPVVRLVRVRIGSLTDRSLKPGKWRPLSLEELKALQRESSGAGIVSAARRS